MTKDKDFKQLARARSARTGEAYSTARRNLTAKSAEPQIDARWYWFTRASKGYGGKAAKPTGYESHHLVLEDRAPAFTSSTVRFANYGTHEFTVSSRRDVNASTFVYGRGRTALVVESRLQGSGWSGVAMDGELIDLASLGHDAAAALSYKFLFELPNGPDAVPSVVARFLPLTLPREKGELAEYVPVPEDGFPQWRPTTIKSWFPLMGASRDSLVTPRVISCAGLADLKIGRKTIGAYRYDHVDRRGKIHATTWIGQSDEVVQYEQAGLLLKAVSEEEARKFEPGK